MRVLTRPRPFDEPLYVSKNIAWHFISCRCAGVVSSTRVRGPRGSLAASILIHASMCSDGVTLDHALELFQMRIPLHTSTEVTRSGRPVPPSELRSQRRSHGHNSNYARLDRVEEPRPARHTRLCLGVSSISKPYFVVAIRFRQLVLPSREAARGTLTQARSPMKTMYNHRRIMLHYDVIRITNAASLGKWDSAS